VVVSIAHAFNKSSGTNIVGNALVEDEERVGRIRHIACAGLWLRYGSEKATKSAELSLRRSRGLNGLTIH
jgi:hypothetical protein